MKPVTSVNNDSPQAPMTGGTVAERRIMEANDLPKRDREQIRISDGISEKKQILLVFSDKAEADYVWLVCRRKGFILPDYIMDNFEWDDRLPCVHDNSTTPNKEDCDGCPFDDRCPDRVI